MRGIVKDDFRQSGFGFMLFLWFALIGINGYSAEASASAGASITSPASVDNAIVDFWGAAFMSETVAGRLIIRIAGRGLPAEASSGDADTIHYSAIVSDSRFAQLTMADFIKLIASERILSGAIISAVTVSATDVTGFVTVTVAYN
jgi:hypothetical protein